MRFSQQWEKLEEIAETLAALELRVAQDADGPDPLKVRTLRKCQQNSVACLYFARGGVQVSVATLSLVTSDFPRRSRSGRPASLQ